MLYTVRYWLPDADYDSMPFIELLRSKRIFHRSELTWLAFMSSFPSPATRASTTWAHKEKMSGYAPGFTVVSSTSRFANVLFANFGSRFEYVLG